MDIIQISFVVLCLLKALKKIGSTIHAQLLVLTRTQKISITDKAKEGTGL
jgi:hypothetical protein